MGNILVKSPPRRSLSLGFTLGVLRCLHWTGECNYWNNGNNNNQHTHTSLLTHSLWYIRVACCCCRGGQMSHVFCIFVCRGECQNMRPILLIKNSIGLLQRRMVVGEWWKEIVPCAGVSNKILTKLLLCGEQFIALFVNAVCLLCKRKCCLLLGVHEKSQLIGLS